MLSRKIIYYCIPQPKELGIKINIIPTELERYINFNNSNKLNFIDSFQFLSSSIDILVKNLGKDDFKYSNQELDSKLLDLVKQKGFHLFERISDFEKFKEEVPIK